MTTLGGMADGTLWVAILTGGTAVLASWVTSHGTARAARIQAEASMRAEQLGRVREIRRTAYLEFIEQAHITGELYYRVGDVYAQPTDEQAQLARIEQLITDLRDAFDPLNRCTRVVVLEGPESVAEAAESVKRAASDSNRALRRVSQGEPNARERFDEAHRVFRGQLAGFITTARSALGSR